MADAPRIHDPRYDSALAMRALVLMLANQSKRFYLLPINGVPTQDDSIGYPTVFLNIAGGDSSQALYIDVDGSGDSIVPLGSTTLPAASDITIASGVATLTGSVHTIRGEGAASDNLDTISGMADSEFVFLLCGAEAITVRDAAVGGGNIATNGDESLVLATGDAVLATRSGSVIRVTPLSIAAGLPEGSLAPIPDAGSLFVQTTLALMLQELRTTMVSVATADATAVTGALTLTQAVMTARGEGAAADDVDTISGLADSGWAFLVTGAEAITYRDNAVGGGNVYTHGAASIVTATGDMVLAVRSGSNVRVIPIMLAAGIPDGALAAIPDAGSLFTATTLAAMLQEIRTTLLTLAVADITIVTGEVTPVQTRSTIRGEGAAADDCDTITIADGQTVELVTGAEAITYRDFAVGAGNISTRANASIVTATGDVVRATRSGAVAYVEPVMIQAGVPSETPSADDTASASASTTSSKIRDQQFLGALAAAGTNYIAQYAAGAPIDDAVGPFTRMVPPRTVQVVLGGGGANPVEYTIDGTNPKGDAIQDVISATGAGTYQGDVAFTTITRVRSNIDPLGTTDFQTGAGFGLATVCSNIDAVGVDGVLEAPSTADAATGTVVPTSAPNGARLYTVDYRVLPIITDAGHVHGPGNHTHNV